jgi:hypothetical protein
VSPTAQLSDIAGLLTELVFLPPHRAQWFNATHVNYRGYSLTNVPGSTSEKGLEIWFARESLQAVCGVQEPGTDEILDERLIVPYELISRMSVFEDTGEHGN